MNTQDFDIEIIDETPADEIEIVDAPESIQLVSEDEIPEFDVVEESEAYAPVVELSEWQNPGDFESYVVRSAREVPPTFDGSKNSLRRAWRYLKMLQAELIEGVEQDAPYAELSEDHLRTLDSVEEGIEAALQQLAGAIDGNITKTATKSSGYVYYVNPFLYSVARIMINSKVSQGKNIEDVFGKLNDKYKLNDREKLELQFILNDMGHPIRSSFVDHIDMAETYFA